MKDRKLVRVPFPHAGASGSDESFMIEILAATESSLSEMRRAFAEELRQTAAFTAGAVTKAQLATPGTFPMQTIGHTGRQQVNLPSEDTSLNLRYLPDASGRQKAPVLSEPLRNATGPVNDQADRYRRELAAQKAHFGDMLTAAKAHADQVGMINRQSAREKNAIDEKAFEGFLKGMTASLETAARKHREFIGLYKTAAIAQATMDAYAAAASAYKTGVQVGGPLGLVLGPAFAAIAVAAGIANVQQIAAQKFAQGTGYAPGGLALVGEQGPELVNLPRGSQVFTTTQTHNITDNSTRSLTVHLHDHSGSITETLTMDVRSGKAERLIETIMDRLG